MTEPSPFCPCGKPRDRHFAGSMSSGDFLAECPRAQGQRAFEAGAPVSACPFPLDTPEGEAWWDGFRQAPGLSRSTDPIRRRGRLPHNGGPSR